MTVFGRIQTFGHSEDLGSDREELPGTREVRSDGERSSLWRGTGRGGSAPWHVKDSAGKLIHGEDHQVVGGSGSQGHPPRHGGTPGGDGMERRVGRPIRFVIGCEPRLGADERVQAALSGFDRARYLYVCETDQSSTPNDGHAPVFRRVTHGWIGPTGQTLTGLEDVESCQPIGGGRGGLPFEGESGIVGDQVAEQEEGDSKDGMKGGWLFRDQIGTGGK